MQSKYINVKYIATLIIVCFLSSCFSSNNSGNSNGSGVHSDKDTELDNNVTVSLSDDNGYTGNNAKDTTISPQFLVNFSKNIDISTLEKGITLSSVDNPDKNVELSYSNSGSTDTILVKPRLQLSVTSTYKLNIVGPQLKTIEGKHINSKSFYFSTGDDNKLIVSLQYPIGILKDSLKAVDIRLYFSHPIVKADKIENTAVSVSTYTARVPDIEIDKIEIDNNNPNVLHVLLKTNLLTNTVYKININTDQSKGYVIRDELGNVTFNPNTIRFSTRSDSEVSCKIDQTSNLKRFMPEIILRCQNLNDKTVSDDTIKHVTDNMKLFYRDSRDTKLFKNIYKLGDAPTKLENGDVLYKLSSDDILGDFPYYIEVPYNKVSEDKQIPYTMLQFAATPTQSVNSSKIEGFHNNAVNMKEYKDGDENTDTSKLFVFGNGKALKMAGRDYFKSIFIDRYDTDIEKNQLPNLYKKSFVYNLPNDFNPSAYINIIDASLSKDEIYMLVKTNLTASLDDSEGSDNYTILQSDFNSNTTFKAENFYYDELKNKEIFSINDVEKKTPMTVSSVVGTSIIVDKNDNNNFVYVLNNATTKGHKGCVVVSYAVDSAHSLSDFNYSRFFADYDSDTTVYCDKIFSYQDQNNNNRIGVFYHTNQYFQDRGLIVLDDKLEHKIFERSYYHRSSKWGDISIISNFDPSTKKAYIVSAPDNNLTVFSCDLNVNACSEEYNLGNRGDTASGQYNHGLLGLSPIKDQQYIENYQSNGNYVLYNTKHSTYIDQNKGTFVNYIHTSKGYDLTLWNAPSPKPSQYNETNYNLVRI